MTLTEAIELAVERTGHDYFRTLLNPASARYNPAYERVVRQIAETPAWMVDAPPVPPAHPTPPFDPAHLREARRLDQLVNACPHRGCKTGCGNARCHAGKGDQGLDRSIASIGWCRRCVQERDKDSAYAESL